MAFVENNLFACSQDTQELIKERIKEHNLNRVVVASCTPRTHEPTFQETIKEAGLNKYLFQMANIRDQGSWVHQNEPEAATHRAKDQVRMAVATVALQPPLQEFDLPVTKAGLIIGGGVAGMEAALGLAGQGYDVALVEKKDFLGGHARKLNHTWNGEAVQPYVDDLVQRVTGHPRIDVHLNAEVSDVQGFVGNFVSTITSEGRETEVEHGAAIIAIGGHSYKPKEYLYKENPRVLLTLEMDQALREKNPLVTGANPRSSSSAWAPGSRSGPTAAGSAAPTRWKTPSGSKRSIPTWTSTSSTGICAPTACGKTSTKRPGKKA